MKTVSRIIHHMLFHFLSLWGYFNIFSKRKLDCCLYFINLLIWLKWLQANFKQAFPQGRDKRHKRKWILISFLHIKFIPLFISCWVFFSWSCLILTAITQKFHFGLKKRPQFIVHDKGFIKYWKYYNDPLLLLTICLFSFHFIEE